MHCLSLAGTPMAWGKLLAKLLMVAPEGPFPIHKHALPEYTRCTSYLNLADRCINEQLQQYCKQCPPKKMDSPRPLFAWVTNNCGGAVKENVYPTETADSSRRQKRALHVYDPSLRCVTWPSASRKYEMKTRERNTSVSIYEQTKHHFPSNISWNSSEWCYLSVKPLCSPLGVLIKAWKCCSHS